MTLQQPLALADAPPQTTEAGASAGSREVVLDGVRVRYALRRARRRSIGFVIGADGLTVSAPRWVGAAQLDAALRDKARWILRKLQDKRERDRRLTAARIDWRDGATVPFLGSVLTVQLHADCTGAVLLGRVPADAGTAPDTEADTTPPPHTGTASAVLRLGLPPQATPVQIREAVQGWLQRQARRVFAERAAVLAPRLGVHVERIALSSARTRWGSASADGSIRLHWRLVHFALPVIDYVVTHELAHLREMNHSPAFWDVVRAALPDYDAARGVLKRAVLPVFE